MLKTTSLSILAVCLMLLIAVPAQAEKPGPKSKNEHMMMKMDLTPDQQKQALELYREHRDKMMPVRDKLDAKMMELDAYAMVDGITKEDVRTITGEIIALRGEIRNERIAFFNQLEKAGLIQEGYMGFGKGMMTHGCPFFDDEFEFRGRGPGRGMGHGHGMGHGMNMGQGMGMGPAGK